MINNLWNIDMNLELYLETQRGQCQCLDNKIKHQDGRRGQGQQDSMSCHYNNQFINETKNFDRDRTRTCNPQIRSLVPYPLGHTTSADDSQLFCYNYREDFNSYCNIGSSSVQRATSQLEQYGVQRERVRERQNPSLISLLSVNSFISLEILAHFPREKLTEANFTFKRKSAWSKTLFYCIQCFVCTANTDLFIR